MSTFSDKLREIDNSSRQKEKKDQELHTEDYKIVNAVITSMKRLAEDKAKQHINFLEGIPCWHSYDIKYIFWESSKSDAQKDITYHALTKDSPHNPWSGGNIFVTNIGSNPNYMKKLFEEALSELGVSYKVELLRKRVFRCEHYTSIFGMPKERVTGDGFVTAIYIYIKW